MNGWQYLEYTWPQLKEAASQDRVILQPVGSVEGHGPHLPCGTDCYIIESICRGVGERIPDEVLVMPVLPYGFASHHLDFPGAIDVDPSLLIELAVSVAKSLIRHGFKRVVFANGHATNSAPLDIASKRVTMETDGICALVDWYKLVAQKMALLRESVFPGGISHACELETSLMLHLGPGLVQMDKAVKDVWESGNPFLWRDLFPPSPVSFMDVWSRISRTGTMGDPTVATAEKGRQIYDEAVAQLVAFVKSFRRYPIGPRIDHH